MTSPKQNKELLGKGIRSLLGTIDSELKSGGKLKTTVVESVTGINRIPVDDIEPNPKQPRRDFDPKALNELAASIKIHNIIQPITVTKLPQGKYQLIAGERRLKASKLAGLKDIPAYIRQSNDAELLELALLENLQRENLNAMEIALSYKRMMEELSFTQEKVAERMSIDRSTVANFIRLLKLPPDIQLAVRTGVITMGHARALINVDTIDHQLYIFKEVKEKDLSVRQTEALVRTLFKEKKPVKKSSNVSQPAAFKQIEDNLASHFSTRVQVKHERDGGGKIIFDYYSLGELNKLLDAMGIIVK